MAAAATRAAATAAGRAASAAGRAAGGGWLIRSKLLLARCCLAEGELAGAGRHAEAALRASRLAGVGVGERELHAWSCAALLLGAESWRLRGSYADARRYIRSAHTLSRSAAQPRLELDAEAALAQLHCDAAEWAELAERLAHMDAMLEANGAPSERAELARWQLELRLAPLRAQLQLVHESPQAACETCVAALAPRPVLDLGCHLGSPASSRGSPASSREPRDVVESETLDACCSPELRLLRARVLAAAAASGGSRAREHADAAIAYWSPARATARAGLQ